MKRKLTLIFALCLGLSLTGCNNNHQQIGDDSSKHEHNYTSEIVEPTCSSEGYTVYKCDCGDEYIDDYVAALGHNWVEGDKNWYCSKCNQSEAYGFDFSLAKYDGENCYVVRDVEDTGVVINGVLNIPRKYESLPVRVIANFSLSSVGDITKKVLIHDNIKDIYSDLWHGTSIWDPNLDAICSLEEVVFDETCKDMRIESGAFANCPNLEKVNIKKGMVKYTPSDAVTTVNGGTADYLFIDTPFFENNAVIKNGLYYIADLLLYADFNELSSNISIDDGTPNIGNCLFNKCPIIKSVSIPSSVISIGQSAFNQCINLTDITFNGTMEEFNQISFAPSAFSGVKTDHVSCLDGDVYDYHYNGWTAHIGE